MVEIVAEVGSAHNGSLDRMRQLIRAAAWCGCDYAKFQLYRPEDMPDRHEGDNEAMYQKLAVPDEWLPEMFSYAMRHEIGLFASVFSVRAVETLLKFDVPYIKIASPDSTKLSDHTYRGIFAAIPPSITTIISGMHQSRPLNSLKMVCPLGHPPSPEDIWEECRRFDLENGDYGYSDHTPGINAPLLAIRCGVQMLEKHLKIDDDCVDAAFSADPKTMKLLCKLAHK